MNRSLTIFAAILVGCGTIPLIVAIAGCAAFPPPTAGLAIQPGPCGLEYRLDAAAGVPLSVPVGGWVVRVEASGDATVTLAQPCKDAPTPQPQTQEPAP
jgi:hypothetical protein